MNSTIERLLGLRVGDAMTETVISLSQNSTMSEAADLLKKNQVSGAPVVDELGHCVGVLSGSDFVRDKAAALYDYPPTHVLSKRAVSGAYYSEEYLYERVENHMSPAVQTVTADLPLLQAARYLCREHIHRLVVVDENAKPIGIISSLDLIAAFIKAVEE